MIIHKYVSKLGGLNIIIFSLFEDWLHNNLIHFTLLRASLVAQPVKNLPAMQETLVRFLGWEDPLEKG